VFSESENETIKELKQMLDYQNTILLAISYISSVLLQSSDDTFEGDLFHAMEIMGEAAQVDRVYIWENQMKGKDLFASQVFEWSNGVKSQQGEDLVHNVSYDDSMPTWENTLSKGFCVSGLAREQPAVVKEILFAQGILSILVVPIFLYGRFWGFVGFDDCHRERLFSDYEEKILRSASELIANALIRSQMEKNILHLETKADQVYLDPLTGMFNRRYFDENMERLISSLSRSGGTLSLMLVDIDFFKKYNDTYGHLKGDECLKLVAETLRDCTGRKEDFAARYGGEEFVVVLPNTNESGARMVAERLIENMRNKNIPHKENGDEKRVTFSIGVTSGEVKHTLSAKDYIHHADTLLYEAKRSGRNKYLFASF
jgi:diguanylate cyclase (GGDEF)-like protein